MSNKSRAWLVLIATCAIAACRFGPTVDKFPSAHNGGGVVADIDTNRPFKAELIEVRDAGLVILSGGQFRLLPYSSIRSFNYYGKKSALDIGRGNVPSSSTRDSLRLVSRFPQGLSPELLQTLLQANGQTELAKEKP